MNKGAYYFPHDCNARNDDKIIAVRMRHGAEGYAIYFMILERLMESADYTSVKDYNILAFDFRVPTEKVKSIIEDFGLFIIEKKEDNKDYISCPSLNDRMIPLDNMREQRRQAGLKSAEKRRKRAKEEEKSTTVERPLNDSCPEKQQRREEKRIYTLYIRGEEKKLKHSLFETLDILLKDEAWIEIYLKNNGFHPSDKELFCDYLKSFFVLEQDRGESYKTEKDAKQHFVNWLRIILEDQAKKQAKQKQTGGGHSRNQSQPISKVGSMLDIVGELLNPQN